MSESVLPMFSSRSFIVSGLSFRSLIHFEFIFVYGVRECSSFILLQVVDQFELWCWRRLLRIPCTARRSNQSILKEISPGCSLEGLMLKLKLQYFGHLMQRADSFEKTPIWVKFEGGMRRG